MDVLEHIDRDSDDSDASEAIKDYLSNASSEAEYCDSSHESTDVRPTSSTTSSTVSSTDSASAQCSSSSMHSQRGVSLLSVLKAPRPSDFSQKRKIVKNPPVGKKKAKPTNS